MHFITAIMPLVLQVTAEHHTLAKYFLELTMVDYEMVHFPPSQVASAAYALTLKVFNCGDWVSSWPVYVSGVFSLGPLLTIPLNIRRHLLCSIIWAILKMH